MYNNIIYLVDNSVIVWVVNPGAALLRNIAERVGRALLAYYRCAGVVGDKSRAVVRRQAVSNQRQCITQPRGTQYCARQVFALRDKASLEQKKNLYVKYKINKEKKIIMTNSIVAHSTFSFLFCALELISRRVCRG